MKFVYNFLIVILLPLGCFAQYSIIGRILNQADTKPLANVSVFLADATIGANTVDDGTFTLKNVKPGKYNLVVSIVGFERYSQPITVNGNITLPDLLIFPKTIALNEVKIKPRDDSGREHYLGLFKSYFLGTSDLAKECTIENPEILDLDFDDATGTLTASTSDLLEIDNAALGYKLHYLLSSFELNTKENIISYKGFAFFSEMKGTSSQERYWRKNREQVYENSVPHFLRSALNSQIDGEGFQVLKLANIANPERPPDAVITAKMSEFKTLNKRDSLSYWTKKSKLPAVFQKLVPTPLNKSDIIKSSGQKGIYALECDNCSLLVTYNKNHHFRVNRQPDHIDDPGNKETTLVTFNAGNSALFDSNGRLLDPNSVSLSGAWANNRIAELLPLDYEGPKTIIASGADSAIIKNVTGKLEAFATNHIMEKAYLHLDKPAYFMGDTIWYKAYTVIGGQHKLSAFSGVLHVELIGPADTVVKRQILELTEGVAWGDIDLSLKLKPGKYHLRAYTNWMRNAGPEYFYDQSLQIYGPAPTQIPVKQLMQANPDVQFFPEGGDLVVGVRSRVAFKAVNAGGLGENIKGTIEDNDGNVVADFAAQHLGMGVFALTPQTGKTYKAKITGPSETAFTVELPKPQETGFVLTVNNSGSDSIRVNITANARLFKDKQNTKFYLIAQSAGKIYYTTAGKLETPVFSANIEKGRFPSGIVQFTLFSESGEPLNERIVFVQNNDGLKLSIGNPVNTSAARQHIKLDIDVKDIDSKPAMGTFSVSVINESRLGIDETAESTILNNLLLASDLQGKIEKPNYYFINPNDQTRAHLDLLMLTQGYHRFEWKQVLNNTAPAITYKPEKLLELEGTVKTKSGTPLVNCKVILSALREGFSTDTITDKEGNFKFTGLSLPDTAKIILSATNADGAKNLIVKLKKIDIPAVLAQKQVENVISLSPEMQATIKKSYFDYQQKVKYDSLKNVKQLREVTIHAQSLELNPVLTRSSNLAGPGHADQVILGSQLTNCIDLSDCLISKAFGVEYIGGKFFNTRALVHVNMTGKGLDTPAMAVIVDGAVTDATRINDINPNDIASVEVLRSGSNTVIYGSAAVGGAFVITMKRTDNVIYKNTPAPGLITYNFPGFYKARTFYSPKYNDTNIDMQSSDSRNTVYWNPNIITDKNGKASFDYFNAGAKGTYRVVIEGIDDNGNLGRLVYRYNVE